MAKVKKCPKCNKVLPVTSFNKRTDSKDGLQGYCRNCQHGYTIEHEPVLQAMLTELDKKFTKTILPNGVVSYKHKDFKQP